MVSLRDQHAVMKISLLHAFTTSDGNVYLSVVDMLPLVFVSHLACLWVLFSGLYL